MSASELKVYISTLSVSGCGPRCIPPVTANPTGLFQSISTETQSSGALPPQFSLTSKTLHTAEIRRRWGSDKARGEWDEFGARAMCYSRQLAGTWTQQSLKLWGGYFLHGQVLGFTREIIDKVWPHARTFSYSFPYLPCSYERFKSDSPKKLV